MEDRAAKGAAQIKVQKECLPIRRLLCLTSTRQRPEGYQERASARYRVEAIPFLFDSKGGECKQEAIAPDKEGRVI